MSNGQGDSNDTDALKSSGKFAFSLSKKTKKSSKPKARVALDQFAAPVEKSSNDDQSYLPKEPLVIPVQEDGRKSLQEQARLKRLQQQSSEDQAAIQALQEEAEGGGPENVVSSSKMVISSDKNTFQQGKTSKDMDNDKEQLEKDLANLAGDLDVDSDVYQKVPIADFGAALLRGMGWEGSQSTKEEEHNMPRPSRLGLGATPKLLDDNNLATHSRRRPRQQHQVRRDEQLRQQQEEYRQKQLAQLALDKQKTLQIGSIVSVGAPGDVVGGARRAILRQLQGVPGLNMILVQMEGERRPTKVKKGEIELLERSELEALPFHELENDDDDPETKTSSSQRERNISDGRRRRDRDKYHEEEGDRRDRRHYSERRSRDDDDRNKERSDDKEDRRRRRRSEEDEDRDHRYSRVKEEDRGSRSHRQEEAKYGSSRDERRRSKDNSNKKRRSRDSDDDDGDEGQKKRSRKQSSSSGKSISSTWVIPSIRVRVVTDKFGRSQYKQKGVVVDVSYKGTATLKMDHNGQVLQVPERYLETALPKAGGNAIVLSGEHKLAKGRLLERDSRSCKGVIQVFEDMNVFTFSLDDMAEWCGPLDDDLME